MPKATAKVETAWYRNIPEDTIHEVIVGSDHEKRIKKAQVELDDDSFEPMYEKISAAEARKNPSKQPGYVTPKGVAASPVLPSGSADVPQTPTADTAHGPLVGEPGAAQQAEAEEDLGGAPPGGVKPEATAAAAGKKSKK